MILAAERVKGTFAYVSEDFKQCVEKHKLTGVNFIWARDIGKYVSNQYYRMIEMEECKVAYESNLYLISKMMKRKKKKLNFIYGLNWKWFSQEKFIPCKFVKKKPLGYKRLKKRKCMQFFQRNIKITPEEKKKITEEYRNIQEREKILRLEKGVVIAVARDGDFVILTEGEGKVIRYNHEDWSVYEIWDGIDKRKQFI